MSKNRQNEILRYLAINGCSGFGTIRREVNKSLSDHHSKKMYELDMSQLCFSRGLVRCVQDHGRVIFSLTRLGELIMCFAKSPALCHEKKSFRRQLAMA